MSEDEKSLATIQKGELLTPPGTEPLLERIRPAWQAKSLIERVKRLLPVDPSSACQRLLNAAIHDLREKIIVAGLDIAKEAAAAHKLPSVSKNEDILDGYSTSNVLDLAYRMGLLSRPEWRRLRRAYDIRRDLEHEDDEYEAEYEDCVYIFKTCIEIVLAKDPVELLRVEDVKELIEAPANVTPSLDFLRDYEIAPDTRQKDIGVFLVGVALDGSKADLTRQNAIEALRRLQPSTRNTVKIELGNHLQERIKRKPLTVAQAKVATAGGFLPYLKQVQVRAFFDGFHKELEQVGYKWREHEKHGSILDELEDLGALTGCPQGPRRQIIMWMTLCYLGEPGGYGTYGRNRTVFYSDSAAPRIERMFKAAGEVIRSDLESIGEERAVKAAVRNKHIARRYQRLLDLVAID